ncbi:MAG: hypothetical protein K2M79_01150 [Muribaculaceae bacterium]|nr:hypothetical protein [Muribaculaceae bacterium]
MFDKDKNKKNNSGNKNIKIIRTPAFTPYESAGIILGGVSGKCNENSLSLWEK